MIEPSLQGRVALVTGGSRGIGRAIARSLAEAGAAVAVNYRARRADAEEVVRAIEQAGGRAIALGADVTRPEEVDALVTAIKNDLGPIDILINNAGVSKPCSLDELDLATWDDTIAANLRSAFLVTSAVLPAMRARRYGRLVFLSSVAARIGGVVGPHYAASKAGLIGLMHGYASLLAKEGITSNAIAPALVETEMVTSNPRARPEMLPVGRFGLPEEAADLVLAVVRNGFLTGQTLQIDGGLYPT